MTDRPMLFSAPMVRALLAGTKTQTRRVMRKQFPADAVMAEIPATDPIGGWVVQGHSGLWWDDAASCFDDAVRCPYGQPGDRLWVRETHAIVPRTAYRCSDGVQQTLRPDDDHDAAIYREGWSRSRGGFRWRPSIHMPRWASRITLEITSVRVERLQDISEADAMAEGCTENHNGYFWGGPHAVSGLKQMATAVSAYRDLWESINGPGTWDANPWVWVVEFKRVEGGAA